VTRPPLTRRREAWAASRPGAVFRGTALNYPAAAEARYAAGLERLISAMVETTEKELAALYASETAAQHAMDATRPRASFASRARILTNALADRFQTMFAQWARPLSESFIKGIDRSSRSSLHGSLKDVSGGLSLKTSVITGRVQEVAKATVTENVGLIKSIPQQYFGKIQGEVMRSITSGNGVQDVLKAVQATGQVTQKRAELIARDQSSKATTAVNAARMQALKIRKFEWLHSGGGKEPRKLHQQLSGQVFRLDDPPIIDERTGERGLPGQLINCRCRMGPVIDFGDDE
jgi:SPP1 gp7 family putative phage head morphogenesis protein